MFDLLKKTDMELIQGDWLIALDRDGTLVPYADRPEEARVTVRLNHLITALAAHKNVQVAIISARSVAQLQGDFDSKRLILAGNYGMEILFPDGVKLIQREGSNAVPALKQVRDELSCLIDAPISAILEDHGFSLCLHWHTVPVQERDKIHEVVQSISPLHENLLFRRLATSYEVLPNFPWDKSKAIASIDECIPKSDSPRFRLFAGDSGADEPGFRWINEQGGISIKVGPAADSAALCQIDEPRGLHKLLRDLVELRRLYAPVSVHPSFLSEAI